jgi:hypothetical protein
MMLNQTMLTEALTHLLAVGEANQRDGAEQTA